MNEGFPQPGNLDRTPEELEEIAKNYEEVKELVKTYKQDLEQFKTELSELEKSPIPDADRIANLKDKIAFLEEEIELIENL